MPELRSGARQARLRSKKLEETPTQQQQQQPPPPLEQAENCVPPAANNRTARRGRGRGSKAAAVAKGPTANQTRPGRGRGRGAIKLIDLDPDQPCEVFPGAAAAAEGAVAGGAQDLLNQAGEGAAGKEVAMDGGSADKLLGEDDANAAPVPEKVWHCDMLVFFLIRLEFDILLNA